MNGPILTPAQAEAITQLGADLTGMMVQRCKETGLDWTQAVAAAAIACRAIAAREIAHDSDLDLDKARHIMFVQFVNVLSMPAELIRVVKHDDDDVDKFQAIILPVVRQ